MKISVVGNRTGWSPDFVFKKLKELGVDKHDIIISGGAEGVDSYAQAYAKEIGAQIRIIYPDPEEPSPKRYYDRNERIAAMCEQMIAFDKNGERPSSGTKNTINHAKKFDREIIVIENEE